MKAATLARPRLVRQDTIAGSPLDKFKLMKSFAAGWEQIQNEPDAQALSKNVLEYRTLLRNYGVPDFRIAKASNPFLSAEDILVPFLTC